MSSGVNKSKKKLKERIEGLSPTKFEVMKLVSRGRNKREIAENTEYAFNTLNQVMIDLEDVVKDTEIDSIEDIDKSLFDSLEPGKSELAIVAEEVLECEKDDVHFIDSEGLRKRLESEYDIDMNNLTVGRRLRNIAGYLDMDDEEYLTNFRGPQNHSRWNLSYIRENYSDELHDIIEENLDSVETDDSDLSGAHTREVETSNKLVQAALSKDYEDVEIEEMNIDEVYEAAQNFDGTLQEFNQALMSKSVGSDLYQVSRVKEENGGWAVDAINPSEVKNSSGDRYGDYAILKRVDSGFLSQYKAFKWLDPDETALDLPE